MRLRVFEFSERFMVLRIIVVILIAIMILMKILTVPLSSLFGNFYFWSILGIFAVVLFPTFATGVLHYDQSPMELLRLPILYNGLFIFVVLFLYRSDSKFVVQLNWLIIVLSLLGVLFAIGLSLYPDVAPMLLKKSAMLHSRYDRPRFSSSMGGEGYSIFYLLAALTKFKQSRRMRIFQIVALFVFAYCMLFVYMGRGNTATLFLVCLIFFVLHGNFRKSIKLVLIVSTFVFFVGIITDFGILRTVQKHWHSTKVEAQYREGSVGKRMDGIYYYANEFRETGYIGTGLVSSTRATNTDIFSAMTIDRYNTADIGIFGSIFQFGFPAVILSIIILKRMFSDLAVVIREGNVNHQPIAIALQMLLILDIVGLGHMFFWHKSSLEWGLYFFMAWRLRDLTKKRTNIQ